jgi:hypothetical protein
LALALLVAQAIFLNAAMDTRIEWFGIQRHFSCALRL